MNTKKSAAQVKGKPLLGITMGDPAGIGPEIAATARAWFDDDENLALVEKLRRAGVRIADLERRKIVKRRPA